MFQSSYQGTETLVNRSMRVLLCIANTRDRELLADQLRSADLSVVTPAATDSMPQFDLCVADTTTFPKVAETIEARRGQLGSVQLPVLLVLGPNDSEQSARAYWDRIDDVLAVPTSQDVFRHRVETLLETRRQSEQLALFARAMDDAHTGISIATAEGDRELLYINDAFEEITGYDREEVVGRNCRFLQGPETEERTVDRLRRAIEAEQPVSVEIRNYRKDGEMFWNALAIAPVHGEGGVTHFVGFQQDVTERVERTQLLQRYEEIVTAAGDPIYALDRDLRFTLSNGATGAFTEQTAAEIRGSHVSTVFGENHAEVLGAAVLDLADSDTQQRSIGTVAEDTEGRPRRLQTTVAALPTEEFEGVVCVSRDITEERERESRLSVLDRVLRHNLRNKLTVMMAQVEQIRWRSDDEAIAESARTIEQAGEDLLELAETARQFKRTVDPGGDDTVSPRDIGEHICHAVQEAGVEHDDATILADVPKPLWARAHDSFELAVTELLERALTAGEDVTVRVSLTADETDDSAHITVSHDGDGLKDVEVEALNAGNESDLRHTQGLGLWFVRWVAVNSGGRFRVENTDSGMEVELRLPLAEPPAA